MDGLILIDKPPKLTSHDVVQSIRSILKIKKAGHYGTLDPLATGLLMIALGKATRFFPFFSKTEKVYKGKIRLGFSTDTYDSLGLPTSREQRDYPDKKNILKSIKNFEGNINQVPPLFSAKKHKGKPLYFFARKKEEVKREPKKIFIHYFRALNFNPPFVDFEVKCSSGTYIRSLAHDLGQSLGCGAHLAQLVRIEVGNFNIKDCFVLEEIKKLSQQGKYDKFLIPLETLFPEYPKIILKEDGLALAKNGNMISPDNILKILPTKTTHPAQKHQITDIFRMFSPEGKLLALAKRLPDSNCLHPFLVIDSSNNKN